MNKKTLSSYPSKLESFGAMVDVVSKFDSAYNPSNPNLSVAKLVEFKNEAALALERTMRAETVFHYATAKRVKLFENQNQLITRIVQILKSLGIHEMEYANLYLVVRQMKGYKKTKIADNNPDQSASNKHTGAYITVEKRTADFLEMINYLEMIPAYKPNYSDLEIAALKAYHQEIVQSNIEVMQTLNTLNYERKLRDHLFFNEIDGIVHLGRMVKSNVRGIFGFSSDQSKQLNPFQFTLRGKK